MSIEIINDNHLQLAEHTLNDDEGFVAVPYQDTKDIWTVGYGFNLQATPMPRVVANLWKSILIEQIDNSLSNTLGYYKRLSDVRKSVLINMAYQMGLGGLSKFKKMHKALMAHDYVTAIDEMKDSSWYRNHKLRGDRLIFMMRFEKECSRQEAKEYFKDQ